MPKILFCCLLLLLGLLLLVPAQAQHYFSDISPTDPDRDAIRDTITAQIMEGYPDGAFHAEAPVSRGEGVVLMARVLHTSLLGFMVLPPPLMEHADLAGISTVHWAYPAAKYLANYGLLDSFAPDGRAFHGQTSVTRGEWLACMARLFHQGAHVSVAAAVAEFNHRALLPPGWNTQFSAEVSRREMARLLADVIDSLTQNAETEGTISAIETDKAAKQWLSLDTELGKARLYLPDIGVVLQGGTKADLHVGVRIHTISDALNNDDNNGPYYRIRKVMVLPQAAKVSALPTP